MVVRGTGQEEEARGGDDGRSRDSTCWDPWRAPLSSSRPLEAQHAFLVFAMFPIAAKRYGVREVVVIGGRLDCRPGRPHLAAVGHGLPSRCPHPCADMTPATGAPMCGLGAHRRDPWNCSAALCFSADSFGDVAVDCSVGSVGAAEVFPLESDSTAAPEVPVSVDAASPRPS